MIPELFKIGPFTVYSYGLMLAVSFIVAGYIFAYLFKQHGLSENYASEITLIAIVCGITGSKLFYVFEEWNQFARDPWGTLFSPGGLTYYGGFLLSIVGIAVYLRRKKIPFLRVADLAAPSLAIAYGIGRIGCHLAGDGDYGVPTNLPWGVNYSNGFVKPSAMFRGSAIAAQYPNGILPDTTPLHPTPVYEFIGGVIIFFILWKLRDKYPQYGKLFMVYLMLTAAARFSVEFLRLNPVFVLGMTQAQFISVVLFVTGIIGFTKLKTVPAAPASQSAENKPGKKKR